MTRDPIRVAPADTLADALRLTREHRIRHLPVVEGGELVGIVSDRDIRLAMPSPLTVADDDRAAFLQRTPVSAIMTREVISAGPLDTVEDAAKLFRRHRVGSLPVVDAAGGLLGILTETDILHVFAELLDGGQPSSRLEIVLPDRPGELARAVGILGERRLNLSSVLVPPGARAGAHHRHRARQHHRPARGHRGAGGGRLRGGVAVAGGRPAPRHGRGPRVSRAALVWDPAVTGYRLRPDHPFNPKRLELTVSLLEELGLVGGPDTPVVAPRPATRAELLRVHSPEFVDAVERLSEPGADVEEGWPWGLGTDDTPMFPGMHAVTSLVVGATMRAAELVMEGGFRRAFNIAGGLHHAHRDRASGFCVYSDVSAAIAWMREQFDARVLYIDYDAHHGDGPQGIFYEDPNVLTLSVHESGRYLFPGTGGVDELGEGAGYGYSLNLPLEPFTEDESWIALYARLLPDVAEAFRPDVIVLQNGCDGHVLDPLTHLRATTRLYEETVRITCEVADSLCGGRIVATGGGGYSIWRVVPRAWTLVWGGLSGQTVPDAIPFAWQNRWQGESPELLPDRMRDAEGEFGSVPRRAEIEATNRRAFERLRRQAMPLLRGWDLAF